MYSKYLKMLRIALIAGVGFAVHVGAVAESGLAGKEKDKALSAAVAKQGYQAVSLGDLEESRGMQGGVIDVTTLADSHVNGQLTDNVAINTVTGDNIIDNESFKEASGLISVIQNTGNNVIIQDSTVVNVTILP